MVLIIGEILLDNIGKVVNDQINLESHVGGAPFNVANNLSNLNIPVTFYGRVGDDLMGHFIVDNLPRNENLSYDIQFDKTRNTTLAYFIKDEDGEGRFSFLRNNGADYAFNFDEIKKYINHPEIKIAHFGSLCLSDKPARSVVDKLIDELRSLNVLISFDVNYRDDIYSENENYKKYYLDVINKCDFVKFSIDEILLLSGKDDLQSALESFSFLKLILVTMGKDGSLAYYKNKVYKQKLKPIKLVNAVGCGDAFYSGIISSIHCKDVNNLKDEDINYMLNFSNACGALNGLFNGASGAFKSKDEVINYMEEHFDGE